MKKILILILIIILIIGGIIMATYGFCENKCKKEVYTTDETYNKTEVDNSLGGKSDTSHNHDSRYYSKEEVDTVQTETKTYADSEGNTITALFRRSGKVVTVDMQINLIANAYFSILANTLFVPDFAKFTYNEESLLNIRGNVQANTNQSVSQFQPFASAKIWFRSYSNGNTCLLGIMTNGNDGATEILCSTTYIVD